MFHSTIEERTRGRLPGKKETQEHWTGTGNSTFRVTLVVKEQRSWPLLISISRNKIFR